MPKGIKANEADIDHDFIRLLKQIVEDPVAKEKAGQIVYWRRKLQHQKNRRHELGARAKPDNEIVSLPPDIEFALHPSENNVNSTKLGRILQGFYVPSVEEIERIAENFGLPPEHEHTRKLIELGVGYIHFRAELAQEQAQATERPQAAKSRTEKPIELPTSAGQALRRLRESQVELSGRVIVHKDSKEAANARTKQRISMETLALNIGSSTSAIQDIEHDKTRLKESHWTRIFAPALLFLGADDEKERRPLRDLFDQEIGVKVAFTKW